ncbi:MAG: SDR family NAD(P)-dependent oxidoreductase [Candidatus Omnitrophica bacterium]|nr:SDR family NAD(P)-dependent oxidoreductase [Candidatus Omnitrophota bacterium]
MDWSHYRALVTGAGGFIGSHLVERLVELGADTRALVRYGSSGSWGWIDSSAAKDEIEVFVGDVRDRDSLRRAFQGVDIVFHLAALIGIPYSYYAPLSYMRVNAEGTLHVLQTALDAGAKLVVHTSTSEVYGTARYVPMDENHVLQGQSPYSASKIAADKMAEAFHLSFGLPVAVIRPFNTYGPRQSSRAVIPTIITQALTGAEVRLGNLNSSRDFNYVADVIDGFIRVAECGEAIGQVINIGTGKEVSISQLVTVIEGLLGKNIRVVSEDERVRPGNSEVERLCAQNAKAREILQWSPQYTLDKGLARTVEWVRGNVEQYRLGTYAI